MMITVQLLMNVPLDFISPSETREAVWTKYSVFLSYCLQNVLKSSCNFITSSKQPPLHNTICSPETHHCTHKHQHTAEHMHTHTTVTSVQYHICTRRFLMLCVLLSSGSCITYSKQLGTWPSCSGSVWCMTSESEFFLFVRRISTYKMLLSLPVYCITPLFLQLSVCNFDK